MNSATRLRLSICCTLMLILSGSARAQLATFELTGFTVTPLGSASLRTETDGSLTVSNIGSSGLDGVNVDLGDSDGGFLTLGIGDFGEVGDEVRFNPLATAGGIPNQNPGSFALRRTGAGQVYELSVGDLPPGGGGTTLRLLDADGGVLHSVPIQANGVVGEFDFGGGTLETLLPVANRDQIKTYFETGDVPTEAQFNNLIDSVIGVRGFEVDGAGIGQTDISNLEIRYVAPGAAPGQRTVKRTFAQKLGNIAKGTLAGQGGVNLTGLGDAQLTVGGDLRVDNIGSSGVDGVSIGFGEPELEGGHEVAQVKVEKFEVRQQYGQQQGSHHRVSGYESPLYEEGGTAHVNPLYEASIDSGNNENWNFSFNPAGLGTDTFQLTVEQDGRTLIDETIAGLVPGTPAVSLDGLPPGIPFDGTVGADSVSSFFWKQLSGPTGVSTSSSSVALNPALPVLVTVRALNATNVPGGLGAVDLQYGNLPGGATITGITGIPEPATATLACFCTLIPLMRRTRKRRHGPQRRFT